jgi:hypothetical protein
LWGRNGAEGTHIVTHQVRARHRWMSAVDLLSNVP